MAIDTIQAESPAATELTQLEKLYAAWRHAKASWELEMYSPEYYGLDLPQEVADRHCEATSDALNAFLLHPATTPTELSRKLRVFRDEQIAEGWTKAPLIVEQITMDAHSIAFQGGRP